MGQDPGTPDARGRVVAGLRAGGAPEGRAAGGPDSAGQVGAAGLSEAELAAWGERIGATVEPPLVLALRGELGAGKSVLARAIARGAGIAGPMPSPTFNLVYHYEAAGGVEVFHLDLYRLEDPGEVWELGWRDLGEGRQIVLIEWPERAETLLPPDRWDIYLDIMAPERRSVRALRVGAAPDLPAPART